MPELLSREFRIDADHPAFKGHFPDEPIVPGVILLEKVRYTVLEFKPGYRIKAFPSAKFHHPLYPDQSFTVTLSETENDVLRFVCSRGDLTLASGSLIVEHAD